MWEPSGLGKEIFDSKYARHVGETWQEACLRVSEHVANAEENGNVARWTKRFYNELVDNRFNPGGRIWYGSGRPKAQLMNCFVIGTQDSREGWGKSIYDMLVISGTGGGVGLNCSPIRPRGSDIKGTGGQATGAVSLMKMINSVGGELMTGGARRVALMLALDVTHPDLEEFLDSKLDLNQLNNANISIILNFDTAEFQRLINDNGNIDFTFGGRHTGNSISARKLWNSIVENAWKSGEPGVLNGYEANRMSNIFYHAPLISTNPCFRGDTLIAVADGRNAVPIEQLANEGKDVPVYSINANGLVEIKWGRNPRKTGNNAALVEVVLDSGNSLFVTPDHKFVLRTGEIKEAQALVKGDSLPRFTKDVDKMARSNKSQSYYRIHTDTLDYGKRVFEHKLIAQFYQPNEWKSLYKEAQDNGWHKGGIVIHHKDFNGLNNDPDNLQLMNFREHQEYHTTYADVAGSKNPMYGKKHSQETKDKIGSKSIERWSSLEFRTKWINGYSEERKLEDAKLMKENVRAWWHQYYEGVARNTNLDIVWINDRLYVNRFCETCGKSFTTTWNRREQAFCSHKCVNQYPQLIQMRKEGIQKRNDQIRASLIGRQIEVFLDMMQTLQRIPLRKEWEEGCRKANVSYRLRPDLKQKNVENVFGSFRELKESALNYNHKVVEVRLANSADVYNITVDDNHTVGVITEIEDNGTCRGIYTRQCGEQWLEEYGSCNLGALVLPRFVGDGKMDWDQLDESIRIGVRFLDNVLSVNYYPLPEIKENCENVRRIGLGVMGLHSMLLELGMKYSSREAHEFVDKLFDFIKQVSYDASIHLAVEKGPFPAFDHKFLDSGFAKTLKRGMRAKIKEYGIRNCALLTIAPTGTTSMVSGVSGGIEPLFAPAYWRRWRKPNDDGTSVQAKDLVITAEFEKFGELAEGAYDIEPRLHFEMQKIAQKHIDNAVSKTVNLPADYPVEQLADLWLEYLPYLKGTTFYRAGSRGEEPLEAISLKDALDLQISNIEILETNYEEVNSMECPDGICEVIWPQEVTMESNA